MNFEQTKKIQIHIPHYHPNPSVFYYPSQPFPQATCSSPLQVNSKVLLFHSLYLQLLNVIIPISPSILQFTLISHLSQIPNYLIASS